MFTVSDVLLTVALGVLAYMSVWFAVALLLKRRDVIDSAWGLGFVLVAWMAFVLRNNNYWPTVAAVLLVTLWGVRLFVHITARNWKKKEDYRYTQLGKLGIRQWTKTFVTVFLLQGALMLVISLPVIAITIADSRPLYLTAAIGIAVWLFGIIFETIGDYQLQHFLRSRQKGIMKTGLWKYSRHPNYFGEIISWWGAAIVALSYGQLWGLIGAATITFLLLKVSGIPPLEKRYAKDQAYQNYARRTSILIPLPPK